VFGAGDAADQGWERTVNVAGQHKRLKPACGTKRAGEKTRTTSDLYIPLGQDLCPSIGSREQKESLWDDGARIRCTIRVYGI